VAQNDPTREHTTGRTLWIFAKFIVAIACLVLAGRYWVPRLFRA
jgi:hypothetical protein